MPKKLINALTAVQVKNLSAAGVYSDGNGLTLRVGPDGAKSWFQRLRLAGKQQSITLGRYPAMSLADARRKAADNLTAVELGEDPVAQCRAARKQKPAPASVPAHHPTFREIAETVIELRRPTWSSPRHAKQWTESLTKHAFPVIGNKAVDTITTADTLAVLTPIWIDKAETATRVRQRMETVFDFAIVQGYRADNPANGALTKALPRRPRVKRHHPALPYSEVPSAIKSVRESGAGAITKLALEFLVLTASRSGEVRGAAWSEIDLETTTWTIPAARMKARREHRVPLSDRAVDVLLEALALTDDALIFPAKRNGGQLSNMVFEMLLRRLEIPCVPHGFRSSFRDFLAERTSASWAVAESCLAHVSGERASLGYHRTDYFAERRPIMQQWADYLAT